MPELSRCDRNRSPPLVSVPREYNAAYDLIERNLAAGRGAKPAYIDDRGTCTYAELAGRVRRFAGLLGARGIRPEQRVLLCLHDSIDFPTAFLGCIWAGVLPVPVNTLLTAADYEYLLCDSRAAAVLVSAALAPMFAPLVQRVPTQPQLIVAGGEAQGLPRLETLIEAAGEVETPAPTCADDFCFWLYSSGSTGAPKGTVHLHRSLIHTAELFAGPILGLCERDVVFSAAKLFFAYGLGNALTFPLAVGATTVLMAERPTPAAVFARLAQHPVSVFCGVPTLFGGMLAFAEAPARAALKLRLCTSAGEALPEELGRRWSQRYGADILDGLGSTEMLHIFLSNRADAVRYGTTGTPVPGYELRLVDDAGAPVARGEIGELQVRGPSAAVLYWNNREKSRHTFCGEWTRTGDKYSLDADGCYRYAGRSDDMLKVGGIYVSPIEVESALIEHPAVLEAAVVGREDSERLVKPQAFVVLKNGHAATPELEAELCLHVKTRLAPYKYPRWIRFVDELPKTATGKIQRFRLRAMANARSEKI